MAAPQEYGFYSNVNPNVDHPRWSQATERRLGTGLFAARVPTLMFNGYGDQVASCIRVSTYARTTSRWERRYSMARYLALIKVLLACACLIPFVLLVLRAVGIAGSRSARTPWTRF